MKTITIHTFSECCTRGGEICVSPDGKKGDLNEHIGSREDLMVKCLLNLYFRIGLNSFSMRESRNVLNEIVSQTSTRWNDIENLTIAEIISELMDNDGQNCEIPNLSIDPSVDGFSDLLDKCAKFVVNNSQTRKWVFRDGSAISACGVWDLAFPGCDCWNEGPESECNNNHDLYIF